MSKPFCAKWISETDGVSCDLEFGHAGICRAHERGARILTAESMAKLRNGHLVKHRLHAEVFVVTGNYGGRLTAVRSVDITNPDEWEHVTPWSLPIHRES